MSVCVSNLCLFKERKNLTLKTCAPDFPCVQWSNYKQKSRWRAQSLSLTFPKLGRYRSGKLSQTYVNNAMLHSGIAMDLQGFSLLGVCAKMTPFCKTNFFVTGLLITEILGRNSAPFPMPKRMFFPILDKKFPI